MTMSYAQLANLARRATLTAFGLLLLTIAVNRWLVPVGTEWQTNAVIWMVQTIPLLIFLPGLWRGGITTYAWLCFVVLIYFAAAVTRLFLPQWGALDTINLALTVAMFVFALMFIRWRARANRAAAQP
jgi:uncharacterized membrane protein